jgi:hypothetical protein
MLKYNHLTPCWEAIVKNAIHTPRSSTADNTAGYSLPDKYGTGHNNRGDFGIGGGGGKRQ